LVAAHAHDVTDDPEDADGANDGDGDDDDDGGGTTSDRLCCRERNCS